MSQLFQELKRRNVQQRWIECDPLDFGGWMILTEAYTPLGNFDAAIDTAVEWPLKDW